MRNPGAFGFGEIMRNGSSSIKTMLSGPVGIGDPNGAEMPVAINTGLEILLYDAVGWAPKEYNPDDKQSTGGPEQGSNEHTDGQNGGSAPQSGLVWDEASGYYYDAASGFYYDGNTAVGRGASTNSSTPFATHTVAVDPQAKPRPVGNSLGGTIMGVIRGSGRGVVKSDTVFSGSSSGGSSVSASTAIMGTSGRQSTNSETSTVVTPFRTDASALGSYTPPVAAGSGKRRFSEMPQQPATFREQPQTTYRDRAAERRSLYGSSASVGDDLSDLGLGDSNQDLPLQRGSLSDTGAMPFPPGVGGGCSEANGNVPNYEVITADRAVDESNVGNRMLHNMGWQEGLGLGKDGSGIVEPVQAQGGGVQAGLGSQPKKVDPSLEVQAGDSYRTLIRKKAIARFREMS